MVNPEPYTKAKAEVREAFPIAEDMTLQKLTSLPYLNACLSEGLRIFPPAPDNLPRLVPEGGDVICGKFVPGGRCLLGQWVLCSVRTGLLFLSFPR